MSVTSRIEVSWEDQRHINLFNRLHVQHMELQAEVKIHKVHRNTATGLASQSWPQKKLEDLEDASNELILVDEDEVRASDASFPKDSIAV